jgi:hypothetical protein
MDARSTGFVDRVNRVEIGWGDVPDEHRSNAKQR